ncbi:unnamed protein product [Acanthosepion pharaonis]|uniref:Uncharacterized protein n=1 Tax=Acanthosepion pharaonis TaxID=158019 RepID=A0A812C4T4_ACAPH|nr:unnamed protein product [Sepia pharaonis]
MTDAKLLPLSSHPTHSLGAICLLHFSSFQSINKHKQTFLSLSRFDYFRLLSFSPFFFLSFFSFVTLTASRIFLSFFLLSLLSFSTLFPLQSFTSFSFLLFPDFHFFLSFFLQSFFLSFCSFSFFLSFCSLPFFLSFFVVFLSFFFCSLFLSFIFLPFFLSFFVVFLSFFFCSLSFFLSFFVVFLSFFVVFLSFFLSFFVVFLSFFKPILTPPTPNLPYPSNHSSSLNSPWFFLSLSHRHPFLPSLLSTSLQPLAKQDSLFIFIMAASQGAVCMSTAAAAVTVGTTVEIPD